MKRFALLSLVATIAGSAVAQSNTVTGLDGRLTRIDNATYYGRRGPAYPNGEVGMAFLNTMCNPGSVDIPWQAAMAPNHPKFGFLIVRVHDDRIEQISDWSFCKHAFTSINVNGTCGTCQNPGTGSLMGINCSDTYSAGNNASRTWLGPPAEIDPWLGTWDPFGSYFDIGDPGQAGYPAPADGVRSLSTNHFDAVDHRITVQEADLVTAGASYYYALQLIHEGEALANRGDNLAHRGMNPTWNGSSWSFPNNSEGQTYGTVLHRWPGATVTDGRNGDDDGRFFVASKVTPLGGGGYHYEYAIHNVDNSRGGATFRVPLGPGGTASNFSFGDIDGDPANDWTAAQVGSEVVFSAPVGNALEWNTIYNFGFDADQAPGSGAVRLDEARPGPGALFVDVSAEVPGGAILATFATFGAGCEGSVPLPPAACPELNGTGGTLSGSTNSYEYCFRVQTAEPIDVTAFELYTASTSGQITRPAHLYADVAGQPATTPLASTTITVDAASGFYTATFAAPVTVSGAFYIGYENSPNGVISNLTAGQNGVGFYRTGGGSWSQSSLVQRPSYRVTCTPGAQFATPAIGNAGLPVLGSTYQVTLSDAVAGSPAIVFSGFSDTNYLGTALPYALPGAPGCDILVSPQVTNFVLTSAGGTASSTFGVPNDNAFVGAALLHQWAVLDSVNPLGLVVSNACRATAGN